VAIKQRWWQQLCRSNGINEATAAACSNQESGGGVVLIRQATAMAL